MNLLNYLQIILKLYIYLQIKTLINKFNNIYNRKSKLCINNINYTFKDIFTLVWNNCNNNKYTNEIVKIISNDINEMSQVCITGTIGRLVNSLSGFTNIVNIKLTVTRQIQAKYNILEKKLKKYKSNDNLLYNILFKYNFYNLLVEIKIDNNILNTWIEPFDDIIKDLIELDTLDLDKLKENINDDIIYDNFYTDFINNDNIILNIPIDNNIINIDNNNNNDNNDSIILNIPINNNDNNDDNDNNDNNDNDNIILGIPINNNNDNIILDSNIDNKIGSYFDNFNKDYYSNDSNDSNIDIDDGGVGFEIGDNCDY